MEKYSITLHKIKTSSLLLFAYLSLYMDKAFSNNLRNMFSHTLKLLLLEVKLQNVKSRYFYIIGLYDFNILLKYFPQFLYHIDIRKKM